MIETQTYLSQSTVKRYLAEMDPSSKVNVATVPCKYKVGRVLGQGTYAVVKGRLSTLNHVG